MPDHNIVDQPRTVLLVGASAEIAVLASEVFSTPRWDITRVANNQDALAVIRQPFDVVVTSDNTSAFADLDLLRRIRRAHPHTRMIILADSSTPADIVAAMRNSAFTVFTRPFEAFELKHMLEVAANLPGMTG